jgi:hypothetical protein
MHSLGHPLTADHGEHSPTEAHEERAPTEAHEHAEADKAAFDEAKERYEQSRAKLEAAIAAPGRTASVFKWLGIMCWMAGAGLYLYQRVTTT